ncbi:PEP-CTERM sorting domain-containing protein [Crocosphaera sp. XPORK-15E]|uniref:PEP-CTERM sorting domain-containing protein n=1 Tax=Crocosphaera sp. XPORK-15E TaxID=3110247 RepID=UPI002B1F7470|nr:PEP-CTERM sorting domain-containing protein [Crocosphaera sp. XPORK-15E]MEA5537302.1 PEP-CTERM sorting domain-containing protein [Crocosphaera sp. XPORK-15E]
MSNLTTQFNLRTDNNGIPGTIINSPLNFGDKFFVEVLMGDIRPDAVGIISSNISLSFNPNQLQNINNSFDIASLSSPLLPANFPLFRTGILDNNSGTITNLGGAAFPSINFGSPIGINQLDTFSLLMFEVVGEENSIITLDIDLTQTGFNDGTLASQSPNQNQFTQDIIINNTQSVPESSSIFGILLMGILLMISALKKFPG